MRLLILVGLLLLQACSGNPPAATPNNQILAAVKSMPSGGGYDASQAAVDRLAASVSFQDKRFRQDLNQTGPTFCSGATYLVFLRVMERLELTKSLPERTLTRFARLGVKDGEELFGRWNANGPGTAKLFADLGCGINFTSFDHAKPGDFLKLWWTEEIGRKERGHLVVYLGHSNSEVHFWSANEPEGYSRKSVARPRIKHHLFSRLTDPPALAKALQLSPKDPFLSDMLTKDFSWSQISKTCKVRNRP